LIDISEEKKGRQQAGRGGLVSTFAQEPPSGGGGFEGEDAGKIGQTSRAYHRIEKKGGFLMTVTGVRASVQTHAKIVKKKKKKKAVSWGGFF